MDHIVTLDSEAHEIENLLQGTKSMIIHGADEKCNPYGMVENGDVIYFVDSDDSTIVKAKAVVSSVYNSCCLSVEESFEMIIRNQDKLVLPDNLFYRWAGKKYLVLIKLRDIEKIRPFCMVRSDLLYANDWCPAPSPSLRAK
jgi:hypothetical protein